MKGALILASALLAGCSSYEMQRWGAALSGFSAGVQAATPQAAPATEYHYTLPTWYCDRYPYSRECVTGSGPRRYGVE